MEPSSKNDMLRVETGVLILDKSDTSLFFSKPNEYFTVIYKKRQKLC